MAETTTTIDEILYINATDVVKVAATNQNQNTALSVNQYLSNTFSNTFGETFGEFTNNCSDLKWLAPKHVYWQVANALFLIGELNFSFFSKNIYIFCSSLTTKSVPLAAQVIRISLDTMLPHRCQHSDDHVELLYRMFAGRCDLVQPIFIGQHRLSHRSNLSNEADSIWTGNRCGNLSIGSIYLFWVLSLPVKCHCHKTLCHMYYYYVSI